MFTQLIYGSRMAPGLKLDDLKKILDDNKTHLLDVALNVLSAKTMADLETPGSKNLVRNDLVTNFNQALNSEVVEQIYFSEFVVQ